MTEARRPRVESPVSHQQKGTYQKIGTFYFYYEFIWGFEVGAVVNEAPVELQSRE